jgi:hypothetical protein
MSQQSPSVMIVPFVPCASKYTIYEVQHVPRVIDLRVGTRNASESMLPTLTRSHESVSSFPRFPDLLAAYQRQGTSQVRQTPH